MNLIKSVEIAPDGKGIQLNPHASAFNAELSFGVGISAAIITLMIIAFEKTCIRFNDESEVELVNVLNRTLDLFAKRDDEKD